MDETIQPPSHSVSPTPSTSSVEFVLSKFSLHDLAPASPSQPISLTSPSSDTAPMTYEQIWGIGRSQRAIRRYHRLRLRMEARFGPAEMALRDQRKIKRKQMKNLEAAHLKEACMKRELKRAKKTKVSPSSFQTIDIHERVIMEQDSEFDTKHNAFVGQIQIQDRLSAMTQALSEHARDGTRRKEPGRHSSHVDASVSREYSMTGIAVVHKSHRQDWASSWTAKGYRIHEALDQEDAEEWAIWQALQLILEKVSTDRVHAKPHDPCSVAVVYSDSKPALDRIAKATSHDDVAPVVTRKIVGQSRELYRLGVEVQLHWVPGHRKIPGNELADLVSKMARKPVK